MKNILKKILKPFLYYLPQLPNSIRYGQVYRDTYKFLQESQYWSKEQIGAWQLKKLQELVSHAYETVPYYHKLFNKIALKPGDIKCLEDIKKIPYLTKEIIKDNLNDLISNKHMNNVRYLTTGGSTGIPMGFYWQKNLTEQKEQAFLWWLWNLKKINCNDKFTILRGNVIPSNKILKYDKKNKLILSSYHLTDDNIQNMIEELEKYKPNVIQAYPSSLYLLSKWIENNDYTWKLPLKAILTSSENLYAYQEKLFNKVFKTQVFDLYGNAERTVMFNRCEAGSFHDIPFYGLTEILNNKGNPINNEGERGEIITTAFNNFAMPFIRYKTQDIAINTNKTCECGRNWKTIKSIEGRLQELIITKDNRFISMTSLNMHSNVFDNIKQFQFHQKEKGKVNFNLIPNDDFSEIDTKQIEKELKIKLGNDIELLINQVKNIPRTKAGKYRFLLQELPLEFGE